MKRVLTALAATLPFAANAADAISGAVERQPTNWQAIIMFLIFVEIGRASCRERVFRAV